MTEIDHAATAESANQYAMQRPFWESWRWHRKAQVHATLALVEQQRIANLLAYLGHAEGDEYEPLRDDIRKGLGL